ncbi:MAG: SagB/ThcOx family dehydrogenase [Infirmifilum sp.]
MSVPSKLPTPSLRDKPTLREALWCLANATPLQCPRCDLEGLSRILFHLQGIRRGGFRTVPSAGATYPLEVYVFSRNDLLPIKKGIYKYVPAKNALEAVDAEAEFEGFVIAAVTARTTSFYGLRGYRYVRQEIGHALQNLFLSLISHGFSWSLRFLKPRLEEEESPSRVAGIELKDAENYCRGFLVERAFPLDKVIALRSSIRNYRKEGLSEEQLITILRWSVGEVVEGGRVYPSLFGKPRVETYLSVSLVRGIDSGVYYVNPQTLTLEPIKMGDFSEALWRYSLRQQALLKAPVVVILSGIGPEAEVESGIVSQNIYLNVTHEGLGTVAVGAFDDEKIASLTGIDNPLYLMPIGKPTRE